MAPDGHSGRNTDRVPADRAPADRVPGDRVPGDRVLTGPLWIVAVVVRLVAAGALIFGPWVDEPSELAGWDVERFQVIADESGRPWTDHPVEYPPGSVAAIEIVAGPSVVATSRTVVVVGLMTDLATALFLGALAGPRAAKAYLVLGLPLVPMGLVRFDTLVTLVAVVGVWALRPGVAHGGPLVVAAARRRADIGFALAVTAAAAIKVWPALLVAAAWTVGRRSAATLTAVIGVAAVAGWLVWADAGSAPVEQVLSLRGATGWHVESSIGAVVALFSDGPARLELNAYRIGSLRDRVVLAGRVLAVAAIGALVVAAMRADRSPAQPGQTVEQSSSDRAERAVHTFGLVALGSVAALLVTAPLLSPQFLIWLTPWAAIVAAGPSKTGSPSRPPGRQRFQFPQAATPALLTLAVTVLTGVTLAVFGPPGLDATVPALLITARNVILAGIVAACVVEVARTPNRTRR